MADGIEVEGLDDFTNMLKDMTIDRNDETKAMRAAIQPIKERLEIDTPKGVTKKLSKVKTSVRKDGLATVGTVKAGAWWDKFQEFGTSQQKKNVGYFERSVRNTEDKAIEILSRELLKKVR
ncbi:hypothetical protein RBU49_06905 [Clostridium sp. MB40-C1]|uniref:HK97-gp10 family putative phage morphogenesis protein n=1 Tax=Clostridium sp. MB40-C1 TaxID=3070996 RepID=UPI0027E18B24|nr:HK97-gp10 family putative phage morphogenesis protein [Clostridium sp. MB40-C1]WMJ81971.1 hypothetical protein RBU49_06905 [Clostridium sp. MB40-C1]